MGAPSNLMLEKIKKLAKTRVKEVSTIKKRVILSKDLIVSRLVKTIGNKTITVTRDCIKSKSNGDIFINTF